ncbi:MAG: hypothetical protein ABSG00_00460 [Terracidiphilus sp.]
MLIVFLRWGFLIFVPSIHESALGMKKPAGFSRRRASGFFDLSGRLLQAMTVRRHGTSMMVVMTVMAAALHLIEMLGEDPAPCQILGFSLVCSALPTMAIAISGI